MIDLNYKYNARHLEMELKWFQKVVETRFNLHHNLPDKFDSILKVTPPELNGHPSIYQQFLTDYQLQFEQRLILILAMVPHIQPYILNDFFKKINPNPQTELMLDRSAVFIPTVETALFLLAGENLSKRFYYEQLFNPDNLLVGQNLIYLEQDHQGPSNMDARIFVSGESLSLFTRGEAFRPEFSHAFPAKRITTGLEWEDLILPAKTKTLIREIEAWIEHGDTILHDWGLNRKFSPGYKCLFFGPPGTGKTTTAALIGKSAGQDVYRIDLSMVVSKFIGETEKNLKKIFDTAGNKNWILFFDEADALFSKRTEVQDAHDRFANQEVSYLLQRIEDHPGVIILATNMRSSLDDAFDRRIQNIVYFPVPGREERFKIWKNGFSDKSVLEKAIDLDRIAQKYDMTGGSIMNVIRHASLMAAALDSNIILKKEMINGIQREYLKEGKSL